jgi:hypothetical protein
MKAYGYDNNLVYTGEVEMQRNPRGEGYLQPASSTLITPPELEENQSAKFNIDSNSWEIIPNEEFNAEKLELRDEIGILTYELDENGFAKLKSVESYEIEKAKVLKEREVNSLYEAMVKDVYDEMEVVFGTRNDVSAAATASTYEAMVKRPDNYVGALPGLDTKEAVLFFANEKLKNADKYGVSRMKRIAKFNADKAAVLNA